MSGFYRNIFRTLNDEKVRYLVVGGVAVNLYGVLRATADLDLIIELTDDDVLRFARAMEKLGYKPRVPVTIEDFADPEKRKHWIENKHMLVFSLYNPQFRLGNIDVFVDEPFDFDEAYSRKHVILIDDIEIPLANIDDLIYLKKQAARNQDLADIEGLEIIKHDREGNDG